MTRLIMRRLVGGALALAAFLAGPAAAQQHHFDYFAVSSSSTIAGDVAAYTFDFMPHQYAPYPNPVPSGRATVELVFAPEFDLTAAGFDAAASRAGKGHANTYDQPFPAYAATSINPATGVVRVEQLAVPLYNWDFDSNADRLRVVVRGVRNPATAGQPQVRVRLNYLAPDNVESTMIEQAWATQVVVPPGVVLDANPAAPLTYADEIIASAANPVTLTNLGPQNLRVPLTYNLSASEVRHARLECDSGMVFQPGTAVTFGSSASIGAVNGLGTSAITFSVTAGAAGAAGSGYLNVTGNRAITGTDPVDCTYSLYDFPSQAQAGGSAGRVAMVSGAYLRFASSTAFTSTGRVSTANVEADPAYTRFVASAPTTLGVAALSRLTYGLATPVPLTATGTPIALANLHATGPSGTRIVAAGDFTSAANANGSYTGDALNRVYLSTSNANCSTIGIPAATLSATQATFPVGATAADRMLCLAPRATAAIPASSYTATLDATSAQPTVYAVPDIGLLAAGQIARNGTELQAPLVQVPAGWIARVALTNTGSIARTYAIRVLSANADGSTTVETFDLADDLKTGSIPAGGTKVIRLDDASLAAAARRGTVVVTVSGPNNQIQGLYQVVNPNNGLVTNHVMVRPGSN